MTDTMPFPCQIIQTITTDREEFSGEEGTRDQWMEPTLRDGVKALFQTRTGEVDGITSTIGEYTPWCRQANIYVNNGMEFRTGDRESRSLHVPGITVSSARRLCRLLKVDICGQM
jgi:hypothetical protein